jgi:hypothetical protein
MTKNVLALVLRSLAAIPPLTFSSAAVVAQTDSRQTRLARFTHQLS